LFLQHVRASKAGFSEYTSVVELIKENEQINFKNTGEGVPSNAKNTQKLTAFTLVLKKRGGKERSGAHILLTIVR
jgi:hypothetical protein